MCGKSLRRFDFESKGSFRLFLSYSKLINVLPLLILKKWLQQKNLVNSNSRPRRPMTKRCKWMALFQNNCFIIKRCKWMIIMVMYLKGVGPNFDDCNLFYQSKNIWANYLFIECNFEMFAFLLLVLIFHGHNWVMYEFHE